MMLLQANAKLALNNNSSKVGDNSSTVISDPQTQNSLYSMQYSVTPLCPGAGKHSLTFRGKSHEHPHESQILDALKYPVYPCSSISVLFQTDYNSRQFLQQYLKGSLRQKSLTVMERDKKWVESVPAHHCHSNSVDMYTRTTRRKIAFITSRRKIAFITGLVEIYVSSLHSISIGHILGARLNASRRFWGRTGLALSTTTLGVQHIRKHLQIKPEAIQFGRGCGTPIVPENYTSF